MKRKTRAWLVAVGLVVSGAGMAVSADTVGAAPPGSQPATSEPTDSEPAASEPAASEPAASEPTASQPPTATSVADDDAVDGEYVVMLEPSDNSDSSLQSQSKDDLHARVEQVMNQLADGAAGDVTAAAATDEVITELGVIDGFGARLSPDSAERLAQLPGVAGVYPNTIVTLEASPENPPWGLDRIDQQSLPLDGRFTPFNDGSGVHIYVVDQEILPNHVEFTGRLGKGAAIDNSPLTEPVCYRHGTHVAGTAGGATVGVARAAILHPVRVFGCEGSTPTLTVLRGLDWVANNAELPAVVNMSLGGSGNHVVMASAVDHLAALGITTVVSAGNEADDACLYSPASAPRAITVGASDEKDVVANFSNNGRCIDLYGPGVRVVSAGFSGPNDYLTLRGTSMASPHVAGMAALYLHAHPDATPAQVHDAIVNGAVVNKLTGVPATTPNRLANLEALSDPGTGGPVIDGPLAYIVPVADQLEPGTKTIFDGSRSTDPGGSQLSYAWTVDDSKEVLSREPTFEYWNLELGLHDIRLTVTNAKGQANATVLPVQVALPGTLSPVAILEPVTRQVLPGRKLILDASGSYSPYGGPLSYSLFVQNAAPPYEVVARFEGPTWTYTPTTEGQYYVVLDIADKFGFAAREIGTVTVSSVPSDRAVIVPGHIQTVVAGSPITFDASLSGDYLPSPALENRKYVWTLDNPVVPASTKPTFTHRFEDIGSQWVMVEVSANDASGTQVYHGMEPVLVEVVPSAPPTVVLSPERGVTVEAGQPAVLSGVGTEDPDGGPMKLAWTVSGTAGVVSDDIVFLRIFDQPGKYDVTFQVTDDEGETVKKSTTVTVTKPTTLPVAEFAPNTDQHVVVGTTLNFNGSPSKDSVGGALAYQWRSTGLPGVVSNTVNYERKFDKPGRFGVELTVTNGYGLSGKKHINVWVSESKPPVAEFTPGDTQQVLVGQSLSFDGSKSNDPDGGSVKFEWRSTGLPGLVSETSAYTRRFTKPGRVGVELTVIDDEGERTKKHVNVWVSESKPPVAEFTPGTEQQVAVGTRLSFDGSASNDPDGGSVRFEWRSTGLPGVVDTSTYSRTFDKPGRFGVELTVIDDEGQQAKKHINVWVN